MNTILEKLFWAALGGIGMIAGYMFAVNVGLA